MVTVNFWKRLGHVSMFALVWLGTAAVPAYLIVALYMRECGYPRIAVIPVQAAGIITLLFGASVLLGGRCSRVLVAIAYLLPLLVPTVALVLSMFCRHAWLRY